MAENTQLATTPRAGLIRLEVVTPTGTAVRTDVDQVEAPSVSGEFGVLPGHLPLLAAMRAGVVRYRSAGKTFVTAVGPGFAEAGPDRMSILTDRCLPGPEVDAASVRGELDAVQRRIDTYQDVHEGTEYDELVRSLEWLQAQLDAARETGRGS